MIDKVSIIIPHLYNNQLGYEISTQLNHLKTTHPHIDSVVFTEDDRPQTIIPKFGVMSIAEASDQTGLVIATTPNTATRLIHCWGATHKVFYSYDCFWLRGQKTQYEGLLELYLNNEFDVVVRSKSHKKLLQNNFNVTVKAVIDRFNILDFIKLYEEELCQN